MRPRGYVFEDHGLEISAPDAGVIEKHIIAVVRQVLENIERPREISAAITEKHSFLDVLHNPPGAEKEFNITRRIER